MLLWILLLDGVICGAYRMIRVIFLSLNCAFSYFTQVGYIHELAALC